MGPVHHVHLLLVKKEDKTMRHKMVLAMAGARCRSSAECKTQSEVVLLTSLNIVLLKNGVLNVVSIVQNQIFMLKRIIMKLSKYPRCTQCNRHWTEELEAGPQGRHWALECEP